MKRNSFKLLCFALLGLLVAACSNPKKMAKYASEVSLECNPQVLEAVAGKISATYTINFPAEYFAKKAILEVTPVLVYNGGEIAGPVLTLQGEKVLENNQVVSYENGGSVSTTVTFDYVEGVEKSVLELRATVYNKNRTKSVVYPEPFKIADGTNTTYMLISTHGNPSFEDDKYQKVIAETKEAQVLYLINRYDVRNNQLKSEEVKAFQQFLLDVQKDERRTLKSNDIIAYASPDGAEDYNGKLADRRKQSAEKAFNKTINKKAKVNAPLNVQSIGEDWEGFQELVNQSNIQDKELILRVLSMYSDPAVREREIKNMSSVYTTLAEKVLPELRRARFIANIEYQNWTDEELLQLINNDMDELDEEALLYTANNLVEKPEVMLALYEKAAAKFNSNRAYNNIAALHLYFGRTEEAKAALNKMTEKTSSYYNNMGVLAMQNKDFKAASEYFAKSDVQEAKWNQGAIEVLNGNYEAALACLKGSNLPNEALVYILLKQEDKAAPLLTCKCPADAYKRAIVAARKGDAATAKKELESAARQERFVKRAANDIEFAKIN